MLSRILAVVAVVAMGSSASAQDIGTATLFASSQFTGYSKTVDGPTRSMNALTVKSIRISPGRHGTYAAATRSRAARDSVTRSRRW
jgi:hypothetical protein